MLSILYFVLIYIYLKTVIVVVCVYIYTTYIHTQTHLDSFFFRSFLPFSPPFDISLSLLLFPAFRVIDFGWSVGKGGADGGGASWADRGGTLRSREKVA